MCYLPISVDSYSSYTSDIEDVTSCYSEVTTGIDDTSWYTTASEGTMSSGREDITDNNESSISSWDLASLSLSDTESTSSSSTERMCLHIHCDGRTEEIVRQLYQPLFDWVDPHGHIFNVINEKNLSPGYEFYDKFGRATATVENHNEIDKKCISNGKCHNIHNGVQMPTVEIPSLAIVLFLREHALVGSERVDMASSIFEKEPWKFHHSESISRGKINAYPYNNQNYFTAGPNDPLCAIRQIHCGKQHVRFVRFTSIDTWQDQINLYSLFLGQEPEVYKTDFCMFTVTTQDEYDIQLALKKVPQEIKCRHSSSIALGFRVGQVGDLVPLLPNMCIPISDTRWNTSDLDGNKVYLDVVKPSRDSDSGVSTSYSMKRSKPQKHKKKHNRSKIQSNFQLHSGDESDTSSIITDLDAFMKSILQPMMEDSRSNTPLSTSDFYNNEGRDTPQLSKSSSKSSEKSVRFNHVVNYLTDYTYPSETETEDEQNNIQTDPAFENETESSHTSFSAPPTVKNGYHLYYNDTDEESYYSEAGIDVEGPRQVVDQCRRPNEPPPYKPPPPHPDAQSSSLSGLSGFYI